MTRRSRQLVVVGQGGAGLCAAGNDMQSIMGGEYPGAGAQLGPGMTFGYLAALHAVRRRADRPSSSAARELTI
jgi:hypothetical protein